MHVSPVKPEHLSLESLGVTKVATTMCMYVCAYRLVNAMMNAGREGDWLYQR